MWWKLWLLGHKKTWLDVSRRTVTSMLILTKWIYKSDAIYNNYS